MSPVIVTIAALLFTLNSEFLLSSGGFLKIVRLYVSKHKYELYTSDDEDKQNFDSWFEMNQIAFSTFKEAIESYTRMKYE
jgi:hypothetical protein